MCIHTRARAREYLSFFSSSFFFFNKISKVNENLPLNNSTCIERTFAVSTKRIDTSYPDSHYPKCLPTSSAYENDVTVSVKKLTEEWILSMWSISNFYEPCTPSIVCTRRA